jgi:hypothetical protein
MYILNAAFRTFARTQLTMIITCPTTKNLTQFRESSSYMGSVDIASPMFEILILSNYMQGFQQPQVIELYILKYM